MRADPVPEGVRAGVDTRRALLAALTRSMAGQTVLHPSPIFRLADERTTRITVTCVLPTILGSRAEDKLCICFIVCQIKPLLASRSVEDFQLDLIQLLALLIYFV